MNYPGDLNEAVARWLADAGGNVRLASQDLQKAYRKGEASTATSLAAYLTTRLPATFAVNGRVLAEVAALVPELNPISLLDCGAGPGTASWAAIHQWPSIDRIQQLETLQAFCDLAKRINAESSVPSLQNAQVHRGNLRNLPDANADLVIASYVLAELPADEAASTAASLWERAEQILVLIEPGTPQGFARIRAAREVLKGQGHILAPCTHAYTCPMVGEDWCHFKTRLPRSRAHMHAKSASVPFEDEAFSYVVMSRKPATARSARIIAPVEIHKVAADLRLCDATGLRIETIASRNKPAYKRAKKARWGDLWSDGP